MEIQYLAKTGHDLKFKMAAMPIYGKNHSNDFFPQNHQADYADILQEAYGAPGYIIAKIVPVGI